MVWTQGLTLCRQVLFHLSHSTSSLLFLCLSLFSPLSSFIFVTLSTLRDHVASYYLPLFICEKIKPILPIKSYLLLVMPFACILIFCNQILIDCRDDILSKYLSMICIFLGRGILQPMKINIDVIILFTLLFIVKFPQSHPTFP
jgi:hypothetical protein